MDPIIFESLDTLPEALHPFCVEKDGKFEFTPPASKTDDDVKRLSSTLAKLRLEAKSKGDALEAYRKRLIVDGEELSDETIQELLALRAKAGDGGDPKDLVPKTELAKLERTIKESLGKQHKADVDAKDAENQRLQGLVNKHLVEGGIRSILGDKEFPTPPKSAKAIDAVVALAPTLGKFRVDGESVIATNAEGEDVPMRDYLIAFMSANADLYAAESTGSETAETDGGKRRAIVTSKVVKDMTDQEKRDFIGKFGLDKWNEKLKRERVKRAA